MESFAKSAGVLSFSPPVNPSKHREHEPLMPSLHPVETAGSSGLWERRVPPYANPHGHVCLLVMSDKPMQLGSDLSRRRTSVISSLCVLLHSVADRSSFIMAL